MIWNPSIRQIDSKSVLDSAESETKERLMLQAKAALNREDWIKKNNKISF